LEDLRFSGGGGEMDSRLPEADPEGHRVADVQLFQEDVVQSLSNPGRIGMVTRVGGDSSDSESSDSEDDDEEDGVHDRTLAEGCARIVWIDSPQESVENVSDLQVVDRAFLHGDIVAMASDPLGQTGTVIDVDMSVDLEISNKEIVKDIDSRLLRRVCVLLFCSLV